MANSAQKAEVDADSNADGELEQQIENQAKEIQKGQLADQQKAIASGKLKISSAAAALNNAEMGLDTKEDANEDLSMPLSISTDSIYTDHDDKKQSLGQTTNESATIVRAKQAANKFVDGHPEALFGNERTKILKDNAEAHPVKAEAEDKATLEIEQTADLDSLESGADGEEKFMITAEAESQEDVSIPQWPQYEDPVGQKSQIEKELVQVKTTAEHWKKLQDEATSDDQKDVDKIKYGIWNDR